MPRKKSAPKETEHHALASNLRRLRMEAGLTQLELAERTGSADGTISRLERGRLDPSATLIQKLAGALRVSVDDLLSSKAPLKPAKHRPSIARFVALTNGFTDAQIDDLAKAVKLILGVGRSSRS